MSVWNLYRYRNNDGSSKDWAVTTNPDGSISTRWGKTAVRLSSVNTRKSIRQFDIEKQKKPKAMCLFAEVAIDSDGKVTNPAPLTLSPPLTPPPVSALYWHIDCKADHDTCVRLGLEVRRMLGAIQSLQSDEAVSENAVDPGQTWEGWQQLLRLTLNAEQFTQSGQIKPVHGPLPWLFLLALKHQGFTGINIDIVTEGSREVSVDLKAEPEVLAWFGTDLDSIRPTAELLGLLKPRLNLASALSDTDDCWF